MLGSWDDAKDAVQETYLRGYRSFDSFEGRSSVRLAGCRRCRASARRDEVACSVVLAEAVGNPGDRRRNQIVVNGQPAVTAHLQEDPFGVAVLDVRRDSFAAITAFGDPTLVDRVAA